MKMTYVTYVCNQCGAKDTDKFFPNEQPHLAVACWKCHSGQGHHSGDMLASGKGMFPEVSRRAAAPKA